MSTIKKIFDRRASETLFQNDPPTPQAMSTIARIFGPNIVPERTSPSPAYVEDLAFCAQPDRKRLPRRPKKHSGMQGQVEIYDARPVGNRGGGDEAGGKVYFHKK